MIQKQIYVDTQGHPTDGDAKAGNHPSPPFPSVPFFGCHQGKDKIAFACCVAQSIFCLLGMQFGIRRELAVEFRDADNHLLCIFHLTFLELNHF